MRKFLKQIIIDTEIEYLFKSTAEKEMIKKRRTFYLQFLETRDDIYFDVGANYGNRIEPLIKDGFKIIAIEPQPQCVNFLKDRYRKKITVIPKGLGETETVATMYISNADTISSFSKEWIKATQESGRFSHYNWNKKLEVEITTLDALIATYGRPKFIKIDVEGFEFEVLKGLSQPVKTLSFEYTIPERKNAIINCIDRIVEISKNHNVLFNYSIGESMEWAIEEWISPQKMKEEIELERFIHSEFGDIYAKTT